MEQLTQNLKSGEMKILEVPFPRLGSGMVLVRNHFSLISAGTEGKTVKDARLGYIGKAMARKDEVKKVLKSVKTLGLAETYRLTMNKLDAPSALGYSCAGEVIAVASDVSEFRAGDLVACAGAGAVHAEVVAVPKHLCCLFPKQVDSDLAACTTLGAIALQGVRQSELRLGESCVVIGLGLIGQLTMELLKAAGVKAIGVDIDDGAVALCKKLGHASVFQRSEESLINAVMGLSNGHGADAVIITASSSSVDPVDLAGELCRAKGKVVIVGNVPTGFQRKHYYRKELDLRMSCSYGPGRYDVNYEELGTDYPYAYVRWTEQRNMQAFLELVAEGRINLRPLITHQFNFSEAEKAYKMILKKTEVFSAVLLKYDVSKVLKEKVPLRENAGGASKVNAAVIGAGSFASNVLLPAIQGQCAFTGIVTSRPNNARHLADKYGFKHCSDDADSIFSDKATNTVFISTRHNSHAAYVLQGLKSKKQIFVEKPLCLSEEELTEIRNAYQEAGVRLMVGFNRRFSPLVRKVKKFFESAGTPVSVHYRVNAGILPKDHWTQHPEIGGGRILGEMCHFIDLCAYLCNSRFISVSAVATRDSLMLNDTVAAQLAFENGSIASVSYFSNGSKEMSKEYLEVFGAGQSAVIDDFRELRFFGRSSRTEKFSKQDKGHKAGLSAFIQSIESGTGAPIPFDQIYNSSLATLRALESVKLSGQRLMVED